MSSSFTLVGLCGEADDDCGGGVGFAICAPLMNDFAKLSSLSESSSVLDFRGVHFLVVTCDATSDLCLDIGFIPCNRNCSNDVRVPSRAGAEPDVSTTVSFLFLLPILLNAFKNSGVVDLSSLSSFRCVCFCNRSRKFDNFFGPGLRRSF